MAEFFFPLIPDGEFDAVTATATNAEISVDNYCTQVTPTTAVAAVLSLPAGKKIGQLKKVVTREVPGTPATSFNITLTNHFADASDVIDMNAAGNYFICQWQSGNTDASADEGNGWKVIETGKIDAGSDKLS